MSGLINDSLSTDGVGTTIEITTTESSTAMFNVGITQSINQIITVTYNGTAYTSDFTVPYGAAITATIKSTNKFFDAGKLNITSTTVTSDITIEATNAEVHKYDITITKYDNQRIIVTEVFADEADNIIHTSSFKVAAQSHLRAEVEATMMLIIAVHLISQKFHLLKLILHLQLQQLQLESIILLSNKLLIRLSILTSMEHSIPPALNVKVA